MSCFCFRCKNNCLIFTGKNLIISTWIFSGENQAVIFAPEAKTRQWLYKKEIQAVSIPKYYLDFAEYNEGKLDKIAIFFMNLKKDVQ